MASFNKIYYSHQPANNRCLFTGVDVGVNKRGEHVIPRWMVSDYELNGVNVELGSTQASAKVSQFTAPALMEENHRFGTLEQRIKENQSAVNDDELHLWLMKVMSGMLWNHGRLATNVRHPKAPLPFDDRLEGILAQEFQTGFAQWKAGTYKRRGSLIRLPSSIMTLFLAHAFGSITNIAYSKTHDAILPFLMIMFGRPGHGIVVATFFDEDRTLEQPSVLARWDASPVKDAPDSLPSRAALAVIFHELVVKPSYEAMTEGKIPDKLLDQIAYSLGVEFVGDEQGTIQFRNRSTGHWSDI